MVRLPRRISASDTKRILFLLACGVLSESQILWTNAERRAQRNSYFHKVLACVKYLIGFILILIVSNNVNSLQNAAKR